ncbi:MAG: DUF1822 family protein, partial [Cyanobacteria bacterium J083]
SQALALNNQFSVVQQPEYGELLPGASCLKITRNAVNSEAESSCEAEFRVCLIVTGSLSDRFVNVPRAVLELPEFVADFYVLVAVEEELEQVEIKGCICNENLAQLCSRLSPKINYDFTYSLPLNWFSATPQDLLLWLECLQSANHRQTPLSKASSAESAQTTREKLERFFTHYLESLPLTEAPLAETLHWEQAKVIINNPALLQKLHQNQTRKSEQTILPQQKNSLDNLVFWLGDRLNQFSQDLQWQLLPHPSLGFRGNLEVGEIFEQLENEGVSIPSCAQIKCLDIPTEAKATHHNLAWTGLSLQLYAISWVIAAEDIQPQWTLLLILGSPLTQSVKSEVKLSVKDPHQLITERVLTPDNPEKFLYTQVVGDYQERFWVSLDINHNRELPNAKGPLVYLSPFSFQSEIGEIPWRIGGENFT